MSGIISDIIVSILLKQYGEEEGKVNSVVVLIFPREELHKL